MRFNEMNAGTKARRHEGTKGSGNRPRSILLRRPRGAFSLVEIMIVVVIIGLLAGLVTFATTGIMERAKRKKAFGDVSTLAGAVDQYYLANGKLPDNREGLQVLAPSFIKVLPKDPWGNPYVYVQPGKSGSGTYDIISYGADGREGGTGADADITSNDVEVKDLQKK
jgi:general secretion pathway protein G